MFYPISCFHFLAAACSLISNEMKKFIISAETDAIRKVEERVSCNLNVWVSDLVNKFPHYFSCIMSLLVGWPSGNFKIYWTSSAERVEEVPWGSSELFSLSKWTKTCTCDWWKKSNVCIRPKFKRDASEFVFELPRCCLLSSFSSTKSTGNWLLHRGL